MKKIVLFVMILIVILAVNTVNAADKTVTWTGCGITKKAFMAEIAKSFEEKTGIEVKLSGGGATKGIRSTSANNSELGGTCRHCLLVDPDPEKAKSGKVNVKGVLHQEEKDAKLIHVAWDAVVAITHPDNPVSDISLENLKKIYDGQITNWKELGGPDKRIVLVTRDGKYNGVGHMFRHIVFKNPEYDFKARSLVVKSSGPLEQKVEQTVTALGITGVSSARKRKVKIMSLDGVEPSKENIGSAKYPIWRPLYISMSQKASPEAFEVVNFILSKEGQLIVSKQGTVNLEEGKKLHPLWMKKSKEMGLDKLNVAYHTGPVESDVASK